MFCTLLIYLISTLIPRMVWQMNNFVLYLAYMSYKSWLVLFPNIIQVVCQSLRKEAVEFTNQRYLFVQLDVLQTIISITMGDEVASCLHLIQNLSRFFPYCGLSYADIVAGQGVDPLAHVVCGGKCFSVSLYLFLCLLFG